MNTESLSSSGHDFAEYIKNKHGFKTTKIHFEPIGLTHLVGSGELEGQMVFLYVHDKQSQLEDHLLKKVLADDDLSSTVVIFCYENSCFRPAAILSDSPEIKILGSSYSPEQGPAIVLFKLARGKPASVVAVPMGKMSKVQVTSKFIEEKLSHYLSTNDGHGDAKIGGGGTGGGSGGGSLLL